MWEIEITETFEKWWQALTEKEQDDATAIIELLKERGAHLPFPYSSDVAGARFSQMRELRIQSHGDPIRIFYAFDPRRIAILLLGGMKKGKNEKRFYKEYVAKADTLYEDHLKRLNEDEDREQEQMRYGNEE